MARATLGHTGRELRANGATVLLYALVTIGAVLRVIAPVELIDYTSGMRVSALAWGAAFAIFLAAYGPFLFQPRPGEACRRDANPGLATAKNWFHRSYDIPAYTYEVGDETDREAIRRSAQFLARSFLDQLEDMASHGREF